MKISLFGKTALVTGASGGIGAACALALAEAGAALVLVGRSHDALLNVQTQIESRGGKAMVSVCDITKHNEVANLELPAIDVLVNNAGMNIPEAFLEVTPEHFEQIFDLNVKGAFFVAQRIAATMLQRKQGGVIINVGSQMGHVGAAKRTVYCASKHALEGFTKALAVELAPHKIRVVSVAPTFIETPLTAPMFTNPDFKQQVLASIPLGEIGQAEDVANAVVFLASDQARLVTGSSLLVDGGWTAR